MFTEIVAVGTKAGVQVYDLRRGTRLSQCMGVATGGRQAFGLCDSWVAAVSEKKPMCHVYMLNRGDINAKLTFPLPEELTCVLPLDGGRYLAAGAASGRIIIWATASGKMLGAWDAHYGPVTALSSSEGALVSGGEDTAVHVWVLSQALDRLAGGDAAVTPIVSVAGHTMPVTAIYATPGSLLAGRGRIYTASRDYTCKQWRVRTEHSDEGYTGRAELLATFLYPASVSDIAVDQGETRLFVATVDGLFQTNMYTDRQASKEGAVRGTEPDLAALGGTSDAVFSECHVRYPSTETDIAAVCLSHDGSLLVSASRGGAVRVWDTASRQCIQAINDKQLSTGITQLAARLAPPQLGGPMALASVGVQRPEAISEQAAASRVSSISFVPLQRLYQENVADEATAFEATVKVRLAGTGGSMARFDALLSRNSPYGETARCDAELLNGLRTVGGPAKTQDTDLARQVERLQRHNARTRRLNDELYQGAVAEWLSSR
ncbi:Pre-rRNA-processing protein ipi3 [Coemansia sp. RSA 552]|nr:Pre-rRNA-processing protein ipi3 [Coemansia sp. RSA 552]